MQAQDRVEHVAVDHHVEVVDVVLRERVERGGAEVGLRFGEVRAAADAGRIGGSSVENWVGGRQGEARAKGQVNREPGTYDSATPALGVAPGVPVSMPVLAVRQPAASHPPDARAPCTAEA